MTENIFSGYPSIILDHRPFFSIVVACYNSRNTLDRLLDSIVDQNMEDDLEVILADDNSTESYQDIVDHYRSILSIRQTKTDYNFAPGNTREKGVSIAEGEWITIADHDDEFIENALPQVRDIIKNTGEQYYVITDFLEVEPNTGKLVREMKGTRNWNHGKFYNLDNLWKAYNIHFKKDLLTHEDIYISSCVNSIMQKINGDKPLYINLFTYKWNARPTSVSREKYGEHTFLEIFFGDYITSTGYAYLDQFKFNGADAPYILNAIIEVLLYCYFYCQGFIFQDPVNYKKDNENLCREYLVEIKQTFQIDNAFILNYVSQNNARLFENVREFAKIGCGPFVESVTFAQWLNILHMDIVKKVTMSEAMHKV
jgi:glycosyltransferase involved in cell wall biosynthesis